MLDIHNRPASTKALTAETKLIYGAENATPAVVAFFNNSIKRLDICVDNTIPEADIQVSEYYNTLKKLKERSIEVRYITEITEKNVHYCRQIAQELADVRHLDGVKTNFGVNEYEYMAASFGSENGKPLVQLIHSNIPDIVSQQQYVFETLWNKAIPAKQRISEIELGLGPQRTEVINGVGDTTNIILQVIQNAKNKFAICGDRDIALRIMGFQPYKKAISDAKARGVKIRAIIDISADNIEHCKELLKLMDECRHLDRIKINNGISESEYVSSVFSNRPNLPYGQVIYSNSKEAVVEQSYIFETLWQKAIPAEERIRAIEEGRELEFVEVITESTRIANLVVDFAKSIRKEARLILPKPETIELLENLGVWDFLIYSANNHGSKIQVITPVTEDNSKRVDEIMCKAPSIEIVAGPISAGILFIQDERRYFRTEDKNAEDASVNVDAIRRVIYSNSQNGVESFKSFFKTLWKQSQLYEQLRIANEKLLVHDKMQREFINIAAHELRTPIQPILVSAELLENQLHDNGRIEVTQDDVELIVRNAKRLERLSSDILTVSRIESQTLLLNKESIDLREKISRVIADIRSYIRDGQQLEMFLDPVVANGEKPIIVDADSSKLYEVLSNLLRNAIKFTEEGVINISVKKHDGYVVVSIRDSGAGIDPAVMPRLFEKFITKGGDQGGTGLGLFVSKSIVEAHGGKIWAKNNEDGKGATFAFSLPF